MVQDLPRPRLERLLHRVGLRRLPSDPTVEQTGDLVSDIVAPFLLLPDIEAYQGGQRGGRMFEKHAADGQVRGLDVVNSRGLRLLSSGRALREVSDHDDEAAIEDFSQVARNVCVHGITHVSSPMCYFFIFLLFLTSKQ